MKLKRIIFEPYKRVREIILDLNEQTFELNERFIPL